MEPTPCLILWRRQRVLANQRQSRAGLCGTRMVTKSIKLPSITGCASANGCERGHLACRLEHFKKTLFTIYINSYGVGIKHMFKCFSTMVRDIRIDCFLAVERAQWSWFACLSHSPAIKCSNERNDVEIFLLILECFIIPAKYKSF